MPASALLTEESIPREFKKKLGGITVHGLLASFLAIGGAATESYAPWQATWPSMADFRACMPILWPEKLRTRLDVDAHGYENICSLLAPAIGNGRWAHDSLAGFGERMSRGLLHQQEEKFRRDWETVERVFSEADRDTYLYCWLVVNTRSFYFELPGLKETRPKEDHMVLCPFVDYFNHADHGVSGVEFVRWMQRLRISVTLLSTRRDIQSLLTECMVWLESYLVSTGASVDEEQMLARRYMFHMAAIVMTFCLLNVRISSLPQLSMCYAEFGRKMASFSRPTSGTRCPSMICWFRTF